MTSFSRIHINLVELRRICESVADWWTISVSDLDRLAAAMVPECKRGGVRRGRELAIIASKKFGAMAPKLPLEMAELGRDARNILVDGRADSAVRATAFYHLRFENIHPLVEGNGRVGRTIMTGQIFQSCGVSPAHFEKNLLRENPAYCAVFLAEHPSDSFRMMVELLGKIVGAQLANVELDPRYSLAPLFPEPGRPQKDATGKVIRQPAPENPIGSGLGDWG